jgi:hypothetical protein
MIYLAHPESTRIRLALVLMVLRTRSEGAQVQNGDTIPGALPP